MSLANKISIFRILLAPGIVASLVYYHPDRDGLRFVALGLFLIGIASDAIDGYLARRHNQQTELGTLLDPIADKFLILSTLISCATIQGLPAWMRVPAWFNLIVISRDVLLVAGTMVLFAMHGRWNVRPSRWCRCGPRRSSVRPASRRATWTSAAFPGNGRSAPPTCIA